MGTRWDKLIADWILTEVGSLVLVALVNTFTPLHVSIEGIIFGAVVMLAYYVNSDRYEDWRFEREVE